MLLIGCMSLYTTAGRDGSHASHAVMARAVAAPGQTDGGSHKQQNEGENGASYGGRDACKCKQICDLPQQTNTNIKKEEKGI